MSKKTLFETDLYKRKRMKNASSERTGKSLRKKASLNTKLPKNFHQFLRHLKNKTKLFSHLISSAGKCDLPREK